MTEYDILEARQTEFSFLSDDFENVQTAIQELIMEFELNAIEKTYPFEQWGDNIRRNRRTGEMVETSELSQVFYLYFQRPVSIQKVTSRLNQIPKVDYAEGPGIYFLISDTTPNDPENTDNWAFEAIELQKAWDLARIHQSDYITIAVSDFFHQVTSEYHEDFKPRSMGGNVVQSLSGEPYILNPGATGGERHGIEVGGVIGATTDNGKHISGAAWNLISTPIVGQFSGYIKVDSSVVLGSGFSRARPREKYTSNGV